MRRLQFIGLVCTAVAWGLVCSVTASTEVYLFGGQSNMAFDDNIRVAFKARLLERYPSLTLSTTRSYYGGTGLDSGWDGGTWHGDPPGPDRFTFHAGTSAGDPNIGTAYEALLSNWQTHLESIDGPYEIKGMVWVQGEQDSKRTIPANRYASSLSNLVARLHSDLGLAAGSVEFYYSTMESTASHFYYDDVVRTQQLIAAKDSGDPASIPNANRVDASGLPYENDGVHYTPEGRTTLGERFADAVLANDRIALTPTYTSAQTNGATLGGTVTGGTNITSYGTVWGTTNNPTGNSLAITHAGTNAPFSFSHVRTGMEDNTLTYFRAWASNTTDGLIYSDTASFTTPKSPTFLPFNETFEDVAGMAGTLGSLEGQNNWEVSRSSVATVQNSEAHGGSQACQIQNGYIYRDFTNDADRVRISYSARMEAGEVVDTANREGTAGFTLSTNGFIIVYHAGGSTTTGVAVASGDWNDFIVDIDYSTRKWSLTMGGAPVATGLDFYGEDYASFTEMKVEMRNSDASAYIDDISISEDVAYDSNGTVFLLR